MNRTEKLFVAAFGLLGLRLGLRPIGDNSAFVHIRTGIDIVAGRGIPRTDPYSFTAAGREWVVQSWLASVVYGLAERLGGLEGVVLLNGLLYGALAAVLALLARTGVAWRTCMATSIAIGLGLGLWAPRPLVFGLLAFAATLLVVERARAPWLLVPIAWVWVNTHGSFVLAGVWFLVVVVVGGRARRPELMRYSAFWLGGVLLGALNPLGPKLLAFPLTLLTKSENFTRVVEWGPPTFRSPFGIVGLVAIVALVAVLAAGRRRVPAADVAVVAVFLALGLYSQRNLAPAAVVIAPVLGRALAAAAAADHPSGSVRVSGSAAPEIPHRTKGVDRAFAAVIAAAALVFVAVAATSEPLDLDDTDPPPLTIPGDDVRLLTTDVDAGFVILRDGRDANVFMDDRYDMYPTEVVADYVKLYDGSTESLELLDNYGITIVDWPEDLPLTAILEASPEWRRARTGEFVRR